MDGNTIITILGGLVILAIVIVVMVIRYKNTPSTFDKEAAKSFLDGLSNAIYTRIMEIIQNISFDKYSSLEELEADILSQIYDSIWIYVSAELEEAAKKDILTALALKVLNREFVDKFVESLIENGKIRDKISELWSANFEKKAQMIEKSEKDAENQFNDPKLYNENFDTRDLVKSEDTEEEIDENDPSINPPKDTNEIEYADDDESVEPVEEGEEDTYLDSNGRKRSKSTGRYV